MHTPAPGRPLFQAATANFNPWAADEGDKKNPDRGPMLVITGENDNIVPLGDGQRGVQEAGQEPAAATEIVEIPGVGHSLIIDSSWKLGRRRGAGLPASRASPRVSATIDAGTGGASTARRRAGMPAPHGCPVELRP